MTDFDVIELENELNIYWSGSIRIVDWNKDGWNDIMLPGKIYLNNKNNTFAKVNFKFNEIDPVIVMEFNDLNNDGFPDLVIFIEDAAGKKSIFPIHSQDNERIAPIYFPDILDDMEMSKGYRGKDEYKLVEGVLFRKFPVYPADTTIKEPTNKIRQLMYRVIKGERDSWKFKMFKQFELTTN